MKYIGMGMVWLAYAGVIAAMAFSGQSPELFGKILHDGFWTAVGITVILLIFE